jgi:cell division FtsZ-interacting protein ZapD
MGEGGCIIGERTSGNGLAVTHRLGACVSPRMIRNLLDLAEREAKRALLQTRLQELTKQQQTHQATISLEMVRGILAEV